MITQGKESPLCGPTALANAYELATGKRISLKKAIDACVETAIKTDEYSLQRGADALGLVSSTLTTHHRRAAREWSTKVPAGILCVYGWSHWVTIHGMGDAEYDRKKVIWFDPESKRPEVLTWRRLDNRWKLPAEDQDARTWTYYGIEVWAP